MELERLVAQGLTLIERRNSFEFIRDAAAELYGLHTGQAWRPRTGSMVNRATMTAAMIDSREFINARRRADARSFCRRAPGSPSPAASSAAITTASGPCSTR